MPGWSSGYVTDLDYIHGFYRELAPSLLAFVALARGQRGPDLSAPLTCCELGCGQGFSANLLAAANPGIAFFATDFNPSQIAGAQALAAEAGLENVTFLDADFAEFAERPGLPDSFDIIALHGVWSWISAENRRHIAGFLRRRLKPGGLAYLSYNTLPGWAPFMPLRRLLVDAAAGPGPTAQRIEAALAFVERVRGVNAGYFAQNPAAISRFEAIRATSRSYLAHEYFNSDWTPFHFADVAAELAEAKLLFLGSAQILDHIDMVSLGQEQQALLREAGDAVRREALRDILVNQTFRHDVFARGAVAMAQPELREAWLDQRFALVTARDEIPLKLSAPAGEARLQAEVYNPLLDGFAGGPATLREVLRRAAPAGELGWARLMEALVVLVGLGHLHPALPADDEARRAARTQAFNAAVVRRAEWSDDRQFLASPVTGSGVMVDRLGQLFLHPRIGQGADPAQAAWAALAAQGQKVLREGRKLETPEESLAEIRARHEVFTAKRLPVLRRLGIA